VSLPLNKQVELQYEEKIEDGCKGINCRQFADVNFGENDNCIVNEMLY
jgi:hypothetical protein